MTDSQQTRKRTPEEDIRELYSRTAKLNDRVSALLAPRWGSENGILPTDHPLYVGENPSTVQEQAAPVDWRRRAEQAEELLSIAHETSNRSEAERARAAQRAERAEAAIERVAEVLADHNGDDWSSHPATEAVKAAITFRPAPAPAPAAAEATGAPDTITDPAYLHGQYAAVIRQWWDADDGGADEIATAVLRVRDRHLQQLRQRLALADHELAQWAAAESADAAAGSYAGRAETAEQQRDQYAATLREVLGEFRVKTHPGESCLTTYNIPVSRVQQWRTALDENQEQPVGHVYLSTGCLHGNTVLPDGRTGHAYCQSETGKTGTKTPAQCKFCAAPCTCQCHKEQP